MDNKNLSDILITLSGIASLLAVIGALGYDLWLASTQWLIIAILLAIYGLYAKVR